MEDDLDLRQTRDCIKAMLLVGIMGYLNWLKMMLQRSMTGAARTVEVESLGSVQERKLTLC